MDYPSEKEAELAQRQRRARFKAVFGTEGGIAISATKKAAVQVVMEARGR